MLLACKARDVRVGVLGGTGPAGSGIALRLAAAGMEVLLGSRSEERAAGAVAKLDERWAGRQLPIIAASNKLAAGAADLVVLATPWEGAIGTVEELAKELSGKILVSMVNAMTKWGRRIVPLLPPTGSVAEALASTLPEARVAGAFHHLPASQLGDLDEALDADVLVFSGSRQTTDEVIRLVESVPRLRGFDVGGFGSAVAVEALTAALVEVNMRYKVKASLRLTGIG